MRNFGKYSPKIKKWPFPLGNGHFSIFLFVILGVLEGTDGTAELTAVTLTAAILPRNKAVCLIDESKKQGYNIIEVVCYEKYF